MTGLEGISSAPLPADLRDAPKATQERWRAGLGFEQVLVGQLAKALAATTGGEDGGSAATQTYRSMLPDTLAAAVTASGGIGLARALADDTQRTGTSVTPAAGA
jgi:Rod binding domain-containing protein